MRDVGSRFHSDHDVVKAALILDGWTNTHDPLQIKVGRKDHLVDLGAERWIAADEEGRKMAVEVKSLGGASDVADLEGAGIPGSHIVLAFKPPEIRPCTDYPRRDEPNRHSRSGGTFP